MGILIHVTKFVVFSFNVLCLSLGIIFIAINTIGLEHSLPGTDEHIYFIIGIILGSLLCLTTFVGCYGVVCELIGVCVVYTLFILTLIFTQYLQMHTYPTRYFYLNAVQRLEHAWRLVEMKPHSMREVEQTYHCCGLYDSRDYIYKGLGTPNSCYSQLVNDSRNLNVRGCLDTLHEFYQLAINREKLCNWTLFGSECVVFMFCCIFVILLVLRNRRQRQEFFVEPERDFLEPTLNHIGYRTTLRQH